MRHLSATLALAIALCTASAQAREEQASTSFSAGESTADESVAATAVVDAFGAALLASDFAKVSALLAPDVLILESGGAERSREEYLSHHALADAAFLRDSSSRQLARRVRVSGDLAWVGTESELAAVKSGKPLLLASAETMVLARGADGWRIVHIHWSSRPLDKPAD